MRRRFCDAVDAGSLNAGPRADFGKQLSGQPLFSRWGEQSKRAFDVTASLAGLLLLLPFFVLVAILIRRDSPGPIFYRAWRIGQRGRWFPILKFRTMYDQPESFNGPLLTCKEDDRITPLGRWLRDTKINELPQLWNVLVGDMSLVGPRPEDPEIIKSWPEDVREEICSVKPGITSPASVLYHSEEDLLSKADLMGLYLRDILPDKMRLDQLYVRNRSFLADLDIIIWTLAIFIPGVAGARIPEGYLFAGPLCRFVHRYVSWFLIDLAVALLATTAAGFFWRSQGPLNWGIGRLAVLAFVIAFLFSGFNSMTGLNRILWSHATAEDAIGLVISSGFITALLMAVNRMQDAYGWLPFPALPTPLIITIGLLAQLGFIGARYRLRLVSGVARGWLAWRGNVQGVGEKVLIVGDEECWEMASWLLRSSVFRHAFSIVGFVSSEDPTKQGMCLHGCWILGGIGDLAVLVQRYNPRVIVHAGPRMGEAIHSSLLEICRTSRVQLLHLRELLEMYNLRQELASAAHSRAESARQPEATTSSDAVAGLPGCHLLQDRLRHCFTNGNHLRTMPALLFIQLKGLASIQAAHGEKVIGDLVAEVAARLSACKRNGDVLACYRDHEFVLLFENLPAERALRSLAGRIKASLSRPIAVNGHRVSIGARIDFFAPGEAAKEPAAPSEWDLGVLYARRRSVDLFEAAPAFTPD